MILKTILLMGGFLLFSACSEKTQKSIYQKQQNPFTTHIKTSAENDYKSIKNGENPMNRPSYEEYIEIK